MEKCPTHDGQLRHRGVDGLLGTLASKGINFYRTEVAHHWGGPTGLIAQDDVVLIKVNCQWKCRGTTNTDVIRGLIYRILQHPEDFSGKAVIRGAFLLARHFHIHCRRPCY